MPDPRIEVDGMAELLRSIKSTRQDAVPKLKAASKKAADIVAADAVDRVPVRTGALRDTVRAAGQQAAAVVRAGTEAVPYAAPIHFGWPAHTISPHPFLYEAIDARHDEVIAAYEQAINQITGEFVE